MGAARSWLMGVGAYYAINIIGNPQSIGNYLLMLLWLFQALGPPRHQTSKRLLKPEARRIRL